ncbi:MAG: hypothetical protein [Bacteriophage sp.]|nr:MAG: hypothetical protein [Bacteriophage sp.]
MSNNKYIGMRYVPKILGDNEPWDNKKEYEYLTVVQYQGLSYTSRKNVPTGIDISNVDYWACTGNYNAQVEQYRQETQNALKTVNTKLDGFANTQDGKFQIMLDKYKKDINSYADGKYDDINSQIEEVNNNLNTSKNEIQASMEKATTDLSNTVDGYTTTVNNQITRVETIINSIDLVYDEGTSTDIEDENITDIDGNGGVN